jgi:hypothetical protein
MKQSLVFFVVLLAITIIVSLALYRTQNPSSVSSQESEQEPVSALQRGKFWDFNINLERRSIELENILSGGPGRDGIPALTDPFFVNQEIAQTQGLADSAQGIFLTTDDGGKFYPYTILVWHEIVNDTVDGVPVAVTFCPLCGSAITFDRRVGGAVLEFGVSGFLWESNMVMYDRSNEQSFWSQSIGEGIVGKRTGVKLDLHPMSVITFAELKAFHPDAQVVSQDTGFNRDYGFFPYGSYDETEETIFPISINDRRFFAKELFYIVPFGDISIAIQEGQIPDNSLSIFEYEGVRFTLEAQPDGSLDVTTDSGQKLPGYYEMWFSWAIHHQDNGIVWQWE